METGKLIEELKSKLVPYLEGHGISFANGIHNIECIYKERHKHGTDNKPSMSLLPKKDAMYCFTCGSVVDIFNWANKLEHLPIGNNPEFYTVTLPYLAKKLLNIEYIPARLSPEEKLKHSIRNAYNSAVGYFIQGTPRLAEYIEKRGWDEGIRRRYKLGSVPSFNEFVSFMVRCGYTHEFMQEIGLFKEEIFNETRMLIPIYDQTNRIIRIVGRAMDPNDTSAKYINTKNNILNENVEKLYGINFVNGRESIYLVEGYADVITMYKYGYDNGVAVMGSSINPEQIGVLKRTGVRNITIMLDGDEAWLSKFPSELINVMKTVQINVAIATIPTKQDPDEYLIEHHDLSGVIVETPLKYLMNMKHGEAMLREHKLDMFTDIIASTVSVISREKMIKELATESGTDAKVIRDEVNDKRRNLAYLYYKEEQEIKHNIMRLAKDTSVSAEEIMFYIKDSTKHRVSTIVDPVTVATDILNDAKEHSDNVDDKPAFYLGSYKKLEFDVEGFERTSNFIAISGFPHAGKSSWLKHLLMQIAISNQDVTCVYFTFEDSKEKALPSFLAMLNNYPTNVNKRLNRMRIYGDGAIAKYNDAWSRMKDLTRNMKLLIYDRSIGENLEDIESILESIVEEEGVGNLVVGIDSMNAIVGDGAIEEVIRAATIKLRSMCDKFNCPFFIVTEMKKNDGKDLLNLTGQDISGSNRLNYGADMIIFMGPRHGDIAKCAQYPFDDPVTGTIIPFPIIHMNITKNKINGYLGYYQLVMLRDRCRFIEYDSTTMSTVATPTTEEQKKPIKVKISTDTQVF